MTENVNYTNINQPSTGFGTGKGLDSSSQPLKPQMGTAQQGSQGSGLLGQQQQQQGGWQQTHHGSSHTHQTNMQSNQMSTQHQGSEWHQQGTDYSHGGIGSHQDQDHHKSHEHGLEKSILPEQTFKGKMVEGWDRITGKSEAEIQARQMYLKINDACDQAYDTAKQKANEFAMKLYKEKDRLQRELESKNPEEVRKAREALDLVNRYSTEIFQIIQDKATEATEVIAEKATEVLEQLGNPELVAEIKQHAGEAYEIVKNKAAEAADEINRKTDKDQKLEDKASVAFNVASNKAGEAFRDLKDSRAANEIAQKANQAYDVAASKTKEAASQMYQEGQQSKGIGEAAGKAYDIANQKAKEGADELQRKVGSNTGSSSTSTNYGQSSGLSSNNRPL
jgi:hypothetical protein